jgi:hypothetical protein
MLRVISGAVFTLAASAGIAASSSEAAEHDVFAFANRPEASASSDPAIDAAKAVSRKPKPRVHYSVPPRKKS